MQNFIRILLLGVAFVCGASCEVWAADSQHYVGLPRDGMLDIFADSDGHAIFTFHIGSTDQVFHTAAQAREALIDEYYGSREDRALRTFDALVSAYGLSPNDSSTQYFQPRDYTRTWTRDDNGQVVFETQLKSITIPGSAGGNSNGSSSDYTYMPGASWTSPSEVGSVGGGVLSAREAMKYSNIMGVAPRDPTQLSFGPVQGATDQFTGSLTELMGKPGGREYYHAVIAPQLGDMGITVLNNAANNTTYYAKKEDLPQLNGTLNQTIKIDGVPMQVGDLDTASIRSLAEASGMTYNNDTTSFKYNTDSLSGVTRNPGGDYSATVNGTEVSGISREMLPFSMAQTADDHFQAKVDQVGTAVPVTTADGRTTGWYDEKTKTITVGGQTYTGVIAEGDTFYGGNQTFQRAGEAAGYEVYDKFNTHVDPQNVSIRVVDGKPVAVDRLGQVMDGAHLVPKSLASEYSMDSYLVYDKDGGTWSIRGNDASGSLVPAQVLQYNPATNTFELSDAQRQLNAAHVANQNNYNAQMAKLGEQIKGAEDVLRFATVPEKNAEGQKTGGTTWLSDSDKETIRGFINNGNAAGLQEYFANNNPGLSEGDVKALVNAAASRATLDSLAKQPGVTQGDVPTMNFNSAIDNDLKKMQTLAGTVNGNDTLENRWNALTSLAGLANGYADPNSPTYNPSFNPNNMPSSIGSAMDASQYFFDTSGDTLKGANKTLWDNLRFGQNDYNQSGYYALNDQNRGIIDGRYMFDAREGSEFSKGLAKLGLKVVTPDGGDTWQFVAAGDYKDLGSAYMDYAAARNAYDALSGRGSMSQSTSTVGRLQNTIRDLENRLSEMPFFKNKDQKAQAAQLKQQLADAKKELAAAQGLVDTYKKDLNDPTNFSKYSELVGPMQAAQDRLAAAEAALKKNPNDPKAKQAVESAKKALEDAQNASKQNVQDLGAQHIAAEAANAAREKLIAESRNAANQTLAGAAGSGDTPNGLGTNNNGTFVPSAGFAPFYNMMMDPDSEIGAGMRNYFASSIDPNTGNTSSDYHNLDFYKNMSPEQREAFDKWFGGLSPEERQALQTAGVQTDGPMGTKKTEDPLMAQTELDKKGMDVPHEAKVADIIQLALEITNTLMTDNEFDEVKNVEIAAGDIGEAVGPVEPTALADSDSVTPSGRITSAASSAATLLKMSPVDLDLLSTHVAQEEEENNTPALQTGLGGTSQGQGTGEDGTLNPPAPTPVVDSEYVKEIKRRRLELLRQTVNRVIPLAEGMNAISKDYFERADGFVSDLKPVVTQNGSLGGNQDVSRFVLFENLRASALTGAQMSVQSARILNEQEVVDETTSSNN